jgi:CDGSH-type Zn-finger protein
MTITITIRNNGPYVIAPDQVSQVRLVDHEGNVVPPRSAEGKPMSLCRCGASSVKPFCDGTHSKIGFVGAEAARAAFDAAQAAVKAAAEGGPSVTTTAEVPVTRETAAPPGDPAPLSDTPGAGGPVAQGDGAETGTTPPAPTER